MLARNALSPIERKLKGIYSTGTERKDRADKEVSTSNLVQMLIQEATDDANLVGYILGQGSRNIDNKPHIGKDVSWLGLVALIIAS